MENLTYNQATGSTGEGIAIIGNASGTTVQFNSATLNRTISARAL